MNKTHRLTHEFVEYIPDRLEPGKLYVSIQFATASHLCCCGCGLEVVTPFTPTDWTLSFDGESVSLDPSVGNWSFPCKSHYWIKRNVVHWASSWSDAQVQLGRATDMLRKRRQFETDDKSVGDNQPVRSEGSAACRSKALGIWGQIKKLLRLS